MSRVLSRKNTTSRGTKFIHLFILKKEFNQLFFLKSVTKFKLDKDKVKL